MRHKTMMDMKVVPRLGLGCHVESLTGAFSVSSTSLGKCEYRTTVVLY